MVIDASALAAVLFGEAEGPLIIERIKGHQLFAPAILGFELHNICASTRRKSPALLDDLLRALDDLERMRVRECAVVHREVLMMANDHRLTHYDASYLWLSKQRSMPLVTLDKELIRAASA